MGPNGAPLVLVGLKSDLRDQNEQQNKGKDSYITNEEGKKIKNEYQFLDYIEASAKKRIKVTEVFSRAASVVLK